MGTIIIKDEGSTSPAINSSDQVYLAQVEKIIIGFQKLEGTLSFYI